MIEKNEPHRMALPLLCSLGHISSTATLQARGVSQRQLTLAIEVGRVLRIRRGTYACAHLDGDSLRAAEVGGAL